MIALLREGPLRRFLRTLGKTDSGLAEEKVRQWRRQGYSEQTIQRGLAWATQWAEGTANTVTDNPKLRAEIVEELLPKALTLADQYLKKLTEAIKKGEKGETEQNL